MRRLLLVTLLLVILTGCSSSYESYGHCVLEIMKEQKTDEKIHNRRMLRLTTDYCRKKFPEQKEANTNDNGVNYGQIKT